MGEKNKQQPNQQTNINKIPTSLTLQQSKLTVAENTPEQRQGHLTLEGLTESHWCQRKPATKKSLEKKKKWFLTFYRSGSKLLWISSIRQCKPINAVAVPPTMTEQEEEVHSLPYAVRPRPYLFNFGNPARTLGQQVLQFLSMSVMLP